MIRKLLAAATLLCASLAPAFAAPEIPATLAPLPTGRPVPQPVPATQASPHAYAVADTFKIAGQARWDDITIDPAANLLYVTHPWQTQVIDAANGKIVAEIITPREGGSGDEHHVALVPKVHRGFITSRVTGTVTIFDLKTHAVLGSLAIGDEPTAIAYDPKSDRVLICCSAGRTLVPLAPDADPKTGKIGRAIPFEGMPTAIVVDGQGMAYVTIIGKEGVAVIDTRIMEIATRWPLGPNRVPREIALDPLRSRLFIGSGNSIVILSATDGHELGSVEVGTNQSYINLGGMDCFDGKLFASCGEGALAIISQTPEGRFATLQTVPIAKGCKNLRVNVATGAVYIPAYLARDEIPPPDGKTLPGEMFKIMVIQQK